MQTFLRNVLVQNVTRALSADVTTDLPVNPLLCILYTIKCQQLAATDTTQKMPDFTEVLADVSKLEVLYRGSTVISGNLADLAMVNGIFIRSIPGLHNTTDAASNPLSLTVPIYLGRPHKGGKECFPATRRGELTLHRTFAATFGHQVTTTVTEQIETVELLDAKPDSFLKYVAIRKTPTATGDHDVDLPLGNDISGILLYGSTGYIATPSTASISKLKLLVDNVEYGYAEANWETLNGDLERRIPYNLDNSGHIHVENLAAAYAQDVNTAQASNGSTLMQNYAYLDFDPFDDDQYRLQTSGRGRVHLRITAATADAINVTPIEHVPLAQGAA